MKMSVKKPELKKTILTQEERQKLINNGCSGMRSVLLYCDTLAELVESLQTKVSLLELENGVKKPKAKAV
jgi:hypothetical protein